MGKPILHYLFRLLEDKAKKVKVIDLYEMITENQDNSIGKLYYKFQKQVMVDFDEYCEALSHYKLISPNIETFNIGFW